MSRKTGLVWHELTCGTTRANTPGSCPGLRDNPTSTREKPETKRRFKNLWMLPVSPNSLGFGLSSTSDRSGNLFLHEPAYWKDQTLNETGGEAGRAPRWGAGL
ncbi:MAG: hypothetical protein CM1200mP20_16280 [Pseudomonadota bacterium]|nr:MAG: hypothetical protein CM1200mP20_16280 [Pseudomonadota bacterium]